MGFKLPPLPYEFGALEPYISRPTLEFHHGKHHETYVSTLNSLIEGTPYEAMGLDEIMRQTSASNEDKVFNNAAQAWNHSFFWECMKPGGGGEPGGEILERLRKAFGDYNGFREAFLDAATGHFGSGWAWLALKDGKLAITTTPNAENPLVDGATCLLTCDVWEHAYYLDYQNRREDFVRAFLDHLVNWEYAAAQLARSEP
jgi:Fe-Mn family superoxide dismutase